MKDSDQNQYTEVVEFLLRDEHFAVDLYGVKEIIEYTRVTKLPNAPPHICGIIDLRGDITTIIDPKVHLGIIKTNDSTTEECKIIVLDEKWVGAKIGMLVDEVVTVSIYSTEDIDTSMVVDENNYIKGVIKKDLPVISETEEDKSELLILVDVSMFIHGL